jgi:hypothetical protein
MSDRHYHRPSLRHALVNWKSSDEPFLTKCKLVAKNEWIKARTLKDCCGNYGEPGC